MTSSKMAAAPAQRCCPRGISTTCGCTAQFVSNRVGNPEYRISRECMDVYLEEKHCFVECVYF